MKHNTKRMAGRYVDAFSWHGDINTFLRSIITEAPLLHVCSGPHSDLGDVRVDRYVRPVPPGAIADWTALPDAVRKGIRESDPADVGSRDWQAISLALHDSKGAVVAGLYGATMWSWLMIDGLWVAPQQRRRGLGRRLLLASEDIAIERGCIGSWLGTFDFQAKDFYERHGYSVFAELAGFPSGHSHFHLRKQFSARQ